MNPERPPIVDAGDSAVNDGTGLSTTGTVIGGLVAARVYAPFGKNLNSYVPAVVGTFTVQVRVVTSAPTYVHCEKRVRRVSGREGEPVVRVAEAIGERDRRRTARIHRRGAHGEDRWRLIVNGRLPLVPPPG